MLLYVVFHIIIALGHYLKLIVACHLIAFVGNYAFDAQGKRALRPLSKKDNI